MHWSIALLYGVLRGLGLLPLPWLHALGTGLGRLIWLCNGQLRRVTEHNLDLVLTTQSQIEKQRMACAVLCETGKSFTEVAKIWGRRPERALGLVREVCGGEHLHAARHPGRGLIIAAPHLGCWELLNFWLAAQMPLAIVYRPPRRALLEPLLIKARGALNVEQIRAEGVGVRALYRRLAAGGAVGILPDQQPKEGEGAFAPFFGVEASTMVLLSRLAQRTGAQVLFSFAERLPHGAGFRIHILPAPEGIDSTDLKVACTALNQGVENCVCRAFTQYQWSYKRYSIRPTPLV